MDRRRAANFHANSLAPFHLVLVAMHMQYKVDPDDALALPSFRGLYLLTAAVGLLVAADVLFWWLGYESLRYPAGVNLSLIAAVLGGARIVYGALMALLELDVGADLALAIALVAALLLGEYWVGAEVVLIAMIGESLEALTFARTHREIHKILELRPRQVWLRRGEQQVEVPIEEVAVGDVVVIRPGGRVPVDGAVLAGRSSVDQSTLTGESLPVDKGAGDPVFAGTMNQFGTLEVRAEVIGEQTTLGQVIQLVAEAQHHKGKVERTADRLARYFLPFVLALAAITLVGTNWSRLWSDAFALSDLQWMPTLAVLVVTCPCALILATPAAMMAALAWLARRGVLIKGGVALERLAAVTHLALDKTGTLTAGKLEVGSCLPLDGRTADEVLRLAALAEQSSEHLIARAIVGEARRRELSLSPVSDFLALPGAGVSANMPGGDGAAQPLLVGNRRLMVERQIAIDPRVDEAIAALEAAAESVLLVALDHRVVGLLGVRDTIRPEAAEVIAQLRELGIEGIALLTGDRPAAAAQVATAVGIDRWQAELRPQDKAQWLLRWRDAQQAVLRREVRVGMIGDGVNDAPALATADVGLALAGVGSDLAAEAGDLVLMGDPLTPLPGLVKLSRETVRVIRQNILLFAFFVNFLGIALTAWIMPTWSEAWMRRSPVAAAIFHQAGSVLVLLNAMRLLWFERWSGGPLGRLENWLAERWSAGLERVAPLAALGRQLLFWRWQLARLALYAAVVLYVMAGVVIVGPDEVAVVRRFGRFERELPPGLHLRLPPPFDQVEKHKPREVRVLRIGLASASGDDGQAIEWNSPHAAGAAPRDEQAAVALTGDQSLVEVGATLQYRISSLRTWRFAVSDGEQLLRATAEGALRQVLAAQPLLADQHSAAQREILTTGRGALAAQVEALLRERVERLQLGVEIVPGGVCLDDVHPPLPVVAAFRDVSSAIKEQQRLKNEADATYRETLIKAGGLRSWQLLSSARTEQIGARQWEQLRDGLEGEAAAELLSAEAFAVDAQATAEGSISGFVLMESAHAANPALTQQRLLLDTLSETLAGKPKLIIDDKAQGRRQLLLGMPPAAAPLLPGFLPEEEH